MPRDCTAPHIYVYGSYDVQSRSMCGTQYNMVKKNVNSKSVRKNARPQRARARPRQMVKYVDRPVKPKNTFLGDLGAFAGNGLSKIFGLGAYSLKSNTVMDSISQQVPFMHSSNAEVRLCNREYVCDVSSSVGFTQTTYEISPTSQALFPYLSSLSSSFQEYRFDGLVFEFKSTSASALNSTNTALGTVMLACQYDTAADPFISKQEVLNSMWSADGKPADNLLLPIECSKDERQFENLLIRRNTVSSVSDPHIYSWGNLVVATTGSQAVATIGELWVSYDIVLTKPSSNPNLTSITRFEGQTTNSVLTFSPVAPYGSTISDNKSRPYIASGNHLVIPPGNGKSGIVRYSVGGNTASTAGYDAGNRVITNGVEEGPSLTGPEHGASAYNIFRTFSFTITDTTKPCLIEWVSSVTPLTVPSQVGGSGVANWFLDVETFNEPMWFQPF